MNWHLIVKRVGRLLAVCLLLVVTFSYAMFQGGFVSWFLFWTILPFVVYAILLAIVPIKVTYVARHFEPSKIEKGHDVTVNVDFEIKTWLPLVFLTVKEQPLKHTLFELAEGHATKLYIVGFKRQFEWDYDLFHLKRGEHFYEGLTIELSDFFGWTNRTIEVDAKQMFVVYPKVTPLQMGTVQVQYDQGNFQAKNSFLKDTTIATGLRDYQPGDRFSWVHWKSFAKSGELRTKEFEDRQSRDLFIVMDRSIETNFEDVVDFTASLIQAAKQANEDISFISAGKTRLHNATLKTALQIEKTMHHLAIVHPDAQFTLNNLFKTEQQNIKRSAVLLVVGAYTEDVALLMKNASTYTNTLICFVISHSPQQMIRFAGNYRVIFVTPEQFDRAFMEVANG